MKRAHYQRKEKQYSINSHKTTGLRMEDVKRMGEAETLLKNGWCNGLSTEEIFQLWTTLGNTGIKKL